MERRQRGGGGRGGGLCSPWLPLLLLSPMFSVGDHMKICSSGRAYWLFGGSWNPDALKAHPQRPGPHPHTAPAAGTAAPQPVAALQQYTRPAAALVPLRIPGAACPPGRYSCGLAVRYAPGQRRRRAGWSCGQRATSAHSQQARKVVCPSALLLQPWHCRVSPRQPETTPPRAEPGGGLGAVVSVAGRWAGPFMPLTLAAGTPLVDAGALGAGPASAQPVAARICTDNESEHGRTAALHPTCKHLLSRAAPSTRRSDTHLLPQLAGPALTPPTAPGACATPRCPVRDTPRRCHPAGPPAPRSAGKREIPVKAGETMPTILGKSAPPGGPGSGRCWRVWWCWSGDAPPPSISSSDQ